MNQQELEKRNRTLERRWKIMLVLALIFLLSRPLAIHIVNNWVNKSVSNALHNPYPLVDPARQFIPQENYITNIQPLRDYLNSLVPTEGNGINTENVSIYYEQLNSGANVAVNKDLNLYPASLSKLALALITAHKVESGEWAWDTKFTPQQTDLSSESGEWYKTIGTNPVTVEQAVEHLLVESDNTAQNILLRNVKIPDDYYSLQAETGLEDLFDSRGYVSAKEYSRMLRVLYTSSYLERENSQKILEYMSNSTFHEYLSQGIPKDIKFAHKYGENTAYNIFADSGIVYVPGKPYMITVIYKGEDSSESTKKMVKDLMKEISKRAYEVGK